MSITHRSLRRSWFAGLVAAPTLLGCGETPPAAPVPVVTTEGSTAEQSGTIAAPEPAATRDRALLDSSAAQVGHDVDQETANLKVSVNQTVDAAQTQAKQAATDATDGARGFAAELRNDATQTAAGAQQQVQAAVDGAKDNVRRRARAAGADIGKQVQDAEDKALNGLLGPAPKN